jgi:hypothetical protein
MTPETAELACTDTGDLCPTHRMHAGADALAHLEKSCNSPIGLAERFWVSGTASFPILCRPLGKIVTLHITLYLGTIGRADASSSNNGAHSAPSGFNNTPHRAVG